MSSRPTQDICERIEDLLGQMTLEEKAGQLAQYFYFGPIPAGLDSATLPSEVRRMVQQVANVETAVRTGHAGALLFVNDPATSNRLQRMAVEESRLGIPLLFGYDVVHGLRTIFPVPIALAASWDPELAEQVQSVAAREARAVGIHWAFAPMIDIARDPRWGRIVEGVGEDPHLGAAMAAAQVRGFQGTSPGSPWPVLAGPKHLAGYGAARGGRDYDEVELSDSEFYNVYLPPFRAAIEAGAANVMSAYMELNGVPAAANRWLLTDVLRDELGFEGFTVSDANAVRSLETQHFARDSTDAAARALSAGLDMEMVEDQAAFALLPSAITDGLVNPGLLDQAVRRVLTAKFRLGLFDNPYVDEAAAPVVLGDSGHRRLARRAAERSCVLLKNDGVLPLADGVRSIAVVGALADSARDTLGPWVFAHDLGETVTILAGIAARGGDRVQVDYAPGDQIEPRLHPSPFDRMEHKHRAAEELAPFDADREWERAVDLAAHSDVAVVVVGQGQNKSGETASTSTLTLPARQLALLQAIAATGTPTVAIVMAGRPLDLTWADQHLPAILQAWHPGTQGGKAVADILFGDSCPSGKLPLTWPRHVGQVPMTYSHLRTFAPQDQDKRYWEAPSTPLYPFGFGLSYARFEYANLRPARDSIAIGELTSVSVEVTNTSDRAGDEVAQLYLHQRHGTSARPVRELKGFTRLTLAPGETRTVTFDIGPDQLRYWSAATRGWIQDATSIDLWVGGSSAAELTTQLHVTEPARPNSPKEGN